MEELAQSQQSIGEELQKVISNYKKDSASRKTLSYLEERLRRLDALWNEFDKTDNIIRTHHAERRDHLYFTKDYYTSIREVYDTYRQQISSTIHSMKLDKPQPPSTMIPPGPLDDNNLHADIAQVQTDEFNVKPLSAPSSGGARRKDSGQQRQMLNNGVKGREHLRDEGDNQHLISAAIKITRRQKTGVQSLLRLLDGIESTHEDRKSKQYYQCNLSTIDRHWSQIEACHNEIWELIDEPTTAGYDTQEYIELEQRVQDIVIKLSEGLAQCSGDTTNNNVAMKLPKIVVPTFDGNYLKWRQFYDLFTQMVHNQPLSGCQKMWYLKTNLRGEAEKLIRHFSLSNENYTAAWDMLKARYENSRLLVTALLDKLTSQPKITSENALAIKSLHDTTKETLMGLENLDVPTTNWDPLLLHLLIGKLDRLTHNLYEQSLEQPRALQTVHHFLNFLETRFQALEALGQKGRPFDEFHRKLSLKSRKVNSLVSTNATAAKCVSCTQNHQLFMCRKFLQLTPSNRLKLLRKHNLCVNCLRSGHTTAHCTLRGCTICSKRHNTLVHLQDASTDRPNASQPVSAQAHPVDNTDLTEQSVTLTAQRAKPHGKYVLLSTATILLTTNDGNSIECRALLDSGSQLNLITERIVKRLGLNTTPDLMQVQGIGQALQQAKQRVSVRLQSRVNGFSTRLEAFILKQIIPPQPSQPIDTSAWPIPPNIKLADPSYNQPNRIDLLIGAEHYYSLLSVGQVKLGDGLPILQNTSLGWVLSGRIERVPLKDTVCCIFSKDQQMDEQLEKFWHLEEVAEEKRSITPAERRCEEYFNHTVRRNESGRFIVKLPFLEDPCKLGESRDIASRRFLSLEKRLAKNRELRSQYIDFMEEYQRLGHMEEINMDELENPHYFIPHHAVNKPDSTTTKLRVVFDASCKTSSNVSLNDILATGPTIQDELFSILLRFRLPRFVFTADVEKMYRQILLDEDERRLQVIFWRNDPSHPLKCYQLNTVTYGTTSAPYLATKCLQKLAYEEASTYPLGSEVLSKDFYVDDVMSGANSLATALEMQKQLQVLLTKGGFKLRKWCANHPHLLKAIAPADRESQLTFNNNSEEQIKILGLTWLPASDSFRIKTTWADRHKVTKRTICSDIARIFDPLGIMSPVVITAKMFLQELWTLKMDWDASLPLELHTKWLNFRASLQSLNDVTFPRHVFSQHTPKHVQIHAFADASQRAYGAAIYIRSLNNDKQVIVRLLCAKSRVAPIKQVTLPRLELCAAKLAAELTNRVRNDLNLKDKPVYYWTDSEIVLGWLNSSSSSYHTFVANRVSAIQSMCLVEQWRHVSTKDNPADVLTRGLAPERLEGCNLWFYGPLFLHGAESLWPQPYVKQIECVLEKKRSALPVALKNSPSVHFIYSIDHHNSFGRLKRVTAYILRFVNKLKHRNIEGQALDQLTAEEIHNALLTIIKAIQEDHFKEEITQLKQGELARNSSLNSLTPFLDEKGIMRVGGRLQAADVSYDTKHPMLLPYLSHYTKLLMTDFHHQNLHVGPQTLLAITRQQFWPIKGKTIARSIVQQCVRCSRAKPTMLSQMMGNLPAHRVQPARPFINTGIDFCGPVWTHFKVRGKRPHKSYIAVFCCFSSKATHLEVVSDLTTQAFIGALKRFMARRGHCRNIYCDNATNFVGARNELKELKDVIHSDKAKTEINTICEPHGTDFHFIPPRAPHFGGLWEAAVKSAKHLLTRTVANASLTYEELETIVVQIEAILNSRPITPMSSDPNDISALTPGHFLIGEPLTSATDPTAESEKANITTRWKLVSHLKNEFWKRWSREYLNELQQRHKWKHSSQNLQPGTLVVIKDDNLPALKWPLGRVVNVIKGDDGLVRVADVRVPNNIIRRPIHKLAPLPIQDDNSEPTDTSAIINDDPSSTVSINTTTTQNTSPNGPSEATPTPRKRARLTMGQALSTILMVCLCLPQISATPIEITPFKDHPGLHFENLGTASIISHEWNVIVYYDMANYWKEFEGFLNGTRMLYDLCNAITREKSCTTIITQLEHLKEEIASINLLLGSHSSRSKRGALNFVGNIANALFGVLDSEYAEKMSQTIESVKDNEDHLLQLIRNQTTILDATVNVMKKNEEQVSHQFRELESQVNSLINFTHIISMEIHQEKLTLLFTSLSIQAILVASNLQRAQFSIIDVLADTHHGQVSPQLITPAQLREQLSQIKDNLAPTYKLPVEPQDVLKLYSVMKVAGRATAKHMIFRLSLPLLSIENFELFRIIPIAALINNTFISILPSSQYLIINLHRDTYYPLTESELHSCISIDEDYHICKQTHPLYKKGSHVSSCEVNLLNESPPTSICRLTSLGDEAQWTQLSDPSQWIFAVKGNTMVKIVCGHNVTSATINGSGILKIKEDCVIKHKHIIIQGHSMRPLIYRMSYSATSSIDTISTPEELTAIIHPIQPYQFNISDLQEIKERLNTQLENSKLSDIRTHDIHQLTVGYVAAFLAIVAVAWLVWKFKAEICKRSVTKPTPRPRKCSNKDFSINIDN